MEKLNIPCGKELFTGSCKDLSDCLILIIGPSYSGKSLYCNNFFEINQYKKALNFYISTTLSKKNFDNLFPSKNKSNFFLINPFLKNTLISTENKDNTEKDNSLIDTYYTIVKLIEDNVSKVKNNQNKDNNSIPINFIVDSLSQLFSSFEEHKVMNFLNRLSLFIREYDVTGLFTYSTLDGLQDPVVNKLTSIFDGIIEIQFDKKINNKNRKIRLLYMREMKVSDQWLNITFDKYNLISKVKEDNLYCNLCKEPIYENPKYYLDLSFHEEHLYLYKKLINVYGETNISNTGTLGVLNGNFFFVDVVGLSNPHLSVRKQIEKIELLNNLINNCNSFTNNPDKIILPTGDGMAISFIHNPELPLVLSMQLHSQLFDYNKKLESDSKLGIRIGLGSGPVFIVNDVNNNQNMWGPGIILARRVMDLGNDGHILIERNMAETLINLDEKYKQVIHLLGNYSIKHGQTITLYSAFSDKFGNPEPPEKFKKYDLVEKYMYELVDRYMTKKKT
ncbi:MAG: ATPase domain-containing protein [Nitrososphaeraceae archaeon]